MKYIKIIIVGIILLLVAVVWSFPPTPPGTPGNVATDTIWDAAGDLAVGTGANTAGRLPIGSVEDILKSDGTTAAWTSSPSVATLTARSANSITLGTDSAGSGPAIGSMIFHNATNTNHFSIISGTTGAALSWTLPIVAPAGNDYLLKASTAGILGYTNPATFSIAAGSSSIVTVGALSAGSLTTGFTPVTVPLGGTGASTYALNGVLYGNAANAIGVTTIGAEGQILRVGASPFVPAYSTATYPNTVATGDVLVATNTNVIGVVSKVNNSLLGWNATGVLGAYSNWSFDDSAALVYNVTNPTRKIKLDASGISADSKTVSIKPVASGDVTITTETYAAGTYTVMDKESAQTITGQKTFVAPILGAATATSLLAAGIVDGTAPIVITATSANYQLGTTYKSGYTFINPTSSSASNSAILPAVAAGYQYCVGNYAAKTGTLTVITKTGVGVQYIDLDGVLTANTGQIQATAVAGNFACFVGLSDSVWKAIPTKGVWTKGP